MFNFCVHVEYFIDKVVKKKKRSNQNLLSKLYSPENVYHLCIKWENKIIVISIFFMQQNIDEKSTVIITLRHSF